MNKFFYKIVYLTSAVFLPLFASAQTIRGFFSQVVGIILTQIIPILGGLLIAIFIWGIVKFILAAGDSGKIKEAKDYIVFGLIALFFLVAFWALVQGLMNTFFGGAPGKVEIPLPF